jgi:hypothetical protein
MIEPPSLLPIRLTDYPDAFIRYETPERFHPALEGYLVENYGVFLPVRIRHCQYPWLTNGSDDGDELFSFVILSTAVYRPDSPVIGWVDWRSQPLKSIVLNTNFASSDGRDEEKLQTSLRIVRRGFLRGRPINSGNFPTRETIEAATREAISDLQAQGLNVGIMEVAEELGLSRRHLGRLLKKFGLSWNTLKPQYPSRRRPSR